MDRKGPFPPLSIRVQLSALQRLQTLKRPPQTSGSGQKGTYTSPS